MYRDDVTNQMHPRGTIFNERIETAVENKLKQVFNILIFKIGLLPQKTLLKKLVAIASVTWCSSSKFMPRSRCGEV